MSWGKTIGISIIVSLLLWLVLGYLYGEFMLADTVVPEKGVTIDEWLSYYYKAAVASAVIAILANIAWYAIGVNFSGGSGISMKYSSLQLLRHNKIT